MKVVSQAPTRIGLFGGGTDVGEYAEKYGGLCLNFAINIRQKIELGGEQILLKNDNPDFLRTFTSRPTRHEFDGEIEGGLGSSASLAVTLIAAEAKFAGQELDRSSIAEKAWDIEVNKLGLYGGKQDQYAAAYGGINVFEFKEDVVRTPLSSDFLNEVLSSFVLCYLGTNRKSPKIQEGFRHITQEQIDVLNKIKASVVTGAEIILSRDIEKLGVFFDEIWEQKKASNKGVSNSEIDAIYKNAKTIGAFGGKIMGAGGGGHFLFIVDPSKRISFEEKIGLKVIDFDIDWNGVEARII